MKLLEYIRLALYEIWQNKMRTFLTLIGIIIGISAVIVIVVLVQGAQTFFLNEFRKITPIDVVHVYPRYNSETYRFHVKLTQADIRLIKEKEEERITRITPRDSSSGQLRYQGNHKNCYIYATTAQYYDIYNLELAKGRFLTHLDNERLRQTIVLDHQAAKKLFELENPIGKQVFLADTTFTVVGVLVKESQSVLPSSGFNKTKVFVPLQVWERLKGVKNRYSLTVQVTNPSLAKIEEKRLKTLLNQQYGKTTEGKPKFWFRSAANYLKKLNIMKLALLILLGGAASITLLVAGIGVMNIMLVIVTERTKEIGLRKAIGATKRDILAQFIIESILLCLVGGLLGISCGYAVINLAENILQNYIDLQLEVSGWAILVSLVFTTGVGVFFGFYPALQAARKNPVEALRYE